MIAIQAVIFNYMSKEVVAEVTFDNIGDFEFVDKENNDVSRKDLIIFQSIILFGNLLQNVGCNALRNPKTNSI